MRYAVTTRFFVCIVVTGLMPAGAQAETSQAELSDWIKSAGGDSKELAAWPELPIDSGTAFRTNEAVYLGARDWPSSQRVELPRLNNPIKQVYLLGKSDAELKLTPEPTKWVIRLPQTLPRGGRAVVVVATIGEPNWSPKPQRVKADAAGMLVLPAHQAATHGEMLRYEPQPHKNTVGYWTKPGDWAEWHFDVERVGKYKLHILQGCGKGQGGSKVGIVIRPAGEAVAEAGPLPEPAITFQVLDTGHFQNFVERPLGEVQLDATGHFTLEIRPLQLAHKAVMDVRQVRLVPVDED